MKLCWIVPDDRGGGVISVVVSLCQAAVKEGHEVTLLMLREPTGWMGELGDVQLVSLGLSPEHSDSPRGFKAWLDDNPQHVVFFNSCEEADQAIPFIRRETRCVYVVHDTAARYWRTALRCEKELDAIVAVSETVAKCFQRRLVNPDKLSVLVNGSKYPPKPHASIAREDALLFLGGDNATKGAEDMLRVWGELARSGFGGQLHWFGSVSDRFRARVGTVDKAERLHLHGRTTREVIFEVAAECKVLMMLSRVEPFGMATIEGMSMGTIPVAWDIPTGTREIADSSIGRFAPLGDYTALAVCVVDACHCHPDVVEAVMQRARYEFSDTAMWLRYAEMMERLMVACPGVRVRASEHPQRYKPRFRFFHLLPGPVRCFLKHVAARIPRFGYIVRDLRGI
ncbi:MAG: glycosyltransferase [Verrucomicrobiaceae bacterium]|nr:MAG: glycosyltransferase [Verrucomicrobiaceae bacterium]